MGYLSVACEYFDRPPIVFVLSWVLEVLRNLKVLTPLPKIPVTLEGPQVSWLPRAWRQHFPSKLQCGTHAPTGSCTHHTVKARWRLSLLHPVSQPLLWHPLKSIDCFFPSPARSPQTQRVCLFSSITSGCWWKQHLYKEGWFDSRALYLQLKQGK